MLSLPKTAPTTVTCAASNGKTIKVLRKHVAKQKLRALSPRPGVGTEINDSNLSVRRRNESLEVGKQPQFGGVRILNYPGQAVLVAQPNDHQGSKGASIAVKDVFSVSA